MPVIVEFFKNGEGLLAILGDKPGNFFRVEHKNRLPSFVCRVLAIPVTSQTEVITKPPHVFVRHQHTYLPSTLSWFPDFNLNFPLRWRNFYPLRIIGGRFCSEDVLSGECRKDYFDWLSGRHLIIYTYNMPTDYGQDI